MKKIPLTKNQVALVDDEDYDKLKEYFWQATPARYGWRVSRAYYDDKHTHKILYMHRVILDNPKGLVDHIDGNGLNNQKSNLRIANHKGNAGNSRRGKHNTSGYKGVSWNKPTKKWTAQIKIDGKQTYLGRFKDIKDAAKAYNIAALAHFGIFAKLNTIEV